LAPKNKLQRFAENLTFDNLFQYRYEELTEGFHLKGKWGKDFFNNDHDIILELGCGKGEYTVGLARRNPDRNYIGVDIKGARMWRGLKTAQEEGLKNVAFIRSRINLAGYFFDKDEVSEIWITFPDPQPRQIKTKKRLTSPNFLQLYAQFLKPGGIIHLKTDNIIFYEYTRDVIRENKLKLLYENDDVYGSDLDNEVTSIQTFYEKKWLDHGTKIKYLKYQLGDG
jgi:tRNA (guanine-N7-)-methyltransferase